MLLGEWCCVLFCAGWGGLARHRQDLFPAEMFADLFPSGRGRPSVPADVMPSVIVLQTLHGLSDREAAEAAAFDLRWKAACGLAIDAPAFHPSTLTYWRRRLAASKRPHRIFDVVRQLVIETGRSTAGHGGRWIPPSSMMRSPTRTR